MNQIIQKVNRKLEKVLAPSLCRVTRKLRVGVFPRYFSCPYTEEIYRYLSGKVCSPELFFKSNVLPKLDLAHINYPEHLPWSSYGMDFCGPNLDKNKEIIEQLKQRDIGIMYTQHNLFPHRRGDLYIDIYQAWAEACDMAIHFSEWGKDLVLSHYKFSDSCQHRIIPISHWGGSHNDIHIQMDRASLEKELGLPPCNYRIGIIGAPRRGKKINEFMRAFADCSRSDFQLVVYSLNLDDEIPRDPRIFAMPYRHVDRSLYKKRLSVMDLLAMPYSFEGLPVLASGIPSEAIAFGLPCLISKDWPYLSEYLGKAGIPFDFNHDQIIECLESLDRDAISFASKAAKELQQEYDPVRVAELNWEALKDLYHTKRG
jgi:hypothetical protein